MQKVILDVPFDDGYRYPRTLDEAYGYRAALSVDPGASARVERRSAIISVVIVLLAIACIAYLK